MNSNYQRPPVRVAMIGLGRAAFEEHYPVFRDHPALFQLVAACDIIKERRDIIERDFPDCRMFRRYTDLLDERGIDLVDVITPSTTHLKIALASLSKGFWTLLESPMALNDGDAQILRGAATKAKNRLIVMQRSYFAPEFMLTRKEMSDPRLGAVHQIVVRREDYIRRDDWQAVKRLGGGAAYYAMPDMMMQVLKLLPVPPTQMWSELKRLASLGDAEDYAHVALKTRLSISADVEFNGGILPGLEQPAFVLRGDLGTFSVKPGASSGVVRCIRPGYDFPRRRASVRTPTMRDMHETVPVEEFSVSLPEDTLSGPSAFWRHVYESVRMGHQFPLSVEDFIDALKFSHLMKKTSPFGV